MPIKGQSKPQRRDSASSSTITFPTGERTWTDVEPGKQSLNDYPVSKKRIHLLRHGSLPRDNDGAIEFWRIKDHLQDHFVFCHHWSDEKWKSSMAGGGHKKRCQYCVGSSASELYKVSQDAIILILHFRKCSCSGRFLQVNLSWVCNQFTFHHQFRIDTWRSKI